jgi:hypothetical protein
VIPDDAGRGTGPSAASAQNAEAKTSSAETVQAAAAVARLPDRNGGSQRRRPHPLDTSTVIQSTVTKKAASQGFAATRATYAAISA